VVPNHAEKRENVTAAVASGSLIRSAR
jgi:hypothetical protein